MHTEPRAGRWMKYKVKISIRMSILLALNKKTVKPNKNKETNTIKNRKTRGWMDKQCPLWIKSVLEETLLKSHEHGTWSDVKLS